MCDGCQHSTHEKPKALLIDNALRTTTLDAALALPAAELYTFATDWEGVRVKGKWFLNTAVRKTTVRETTLSMSKQNHLTLWCCAKNTNPSRLATA